jgi:hypothetical protein
MEALRSLKERERERERAGKRGGRDTNIFGFEGSQAVLARPSGTGNAYD